MSTRIEKDFTFQTAVHFEGKFLVNLYDTTLSMTVETSCPREQNIAMDRAIHFLYSVLQNAILVDASDVEAVEKYKNAGIKVCELPEEPYDQVVAMVVLLKLNAIMENRLKVSDLMLSSSLGEGVRYNIVAEVAENVLAGSYWWNDKAITLNKQEFDDAETDDNVLTLFDDSHWVDLGLSWKEKVPQ